MSVNKKVMIVEDDIFLSFVEEKIVTQLGYEVVGKATSGEETLERIDQLNPDILLIDVQLSGPLNGIQTVKKLRTRHFHNPVIFVSGLAEKAMLEQAEELKYVDYLVKPIDMNMLAAPLKKAEKNLSKTYSAA